MRAKRVVSDQLLITKESDMQWLSNNLLFCLQFLLISFGALVVVGACAVVPEQKDWITIGRTTR